MPLPAASHTLWECSRSPPHSWSSPPLQPLVSWSYFPFCPHSPCHPSPVLGLTSQQAGHGGPLTNLTQCRPSPSHPSHHCLVTHREHSAIITHKNILWWLPMALRVRAWYARPLPICCQPHSLALPPSCHHNQQSHCCPALKSQWAVVHSSLHMEGSPSHGLASSICSSKFSSSSSQGSPLQAS